eukprot:TRINITY_DN779982_c0_g1_i1.p1 TRINITY_DN779982_c0_g1~~TRINITY_DN779982_c0_g1_i1.p1  ORF type:complete len:471 (+),score=43.43 TRINITY_DN779982_c0_g1_i1:179-1591(+)
MQKSNTSYLLFITLIAALGGLLFGYDTAVISGTVSSLESAFILPRGLGEDASNSLLGFAVSCALIGCIIGGFFGGLISKNLGRRKGLLLAAFLFLISALGSSMPELGFEKVGEGGHEYLVNFVIYRLIGGIGVGLASMLSPMYISEIVPADKRGKLVSFNQFGIVVGILVVYFINYWIALQGDVNWLNQFGWRWMFASEAIPALIFFIALLFVPESPRYLILKNQENKGLEVLTRINGSGVANVEFKNIKNSVGKPKSGGLFTYGKFVVLIGVFIAFFQQSVGINAVLYYAPEIFKSMENGSGSAMLQTIIVGAVNLIFTVVAIMYVDKWGRKPFQIIGAIGMGFFMIALGTSFYLQSMGAMTLFFMLGFIACFAMSWGPITWILLSELFPNLIRGKAMAVATATAWISNYIVSWSFPILDKSTWLNDLFNHGFAYWMYGTIGIFASLFIWKFVPETKGKSLEEIENFWK